MQSPNCPVSAHCCTVAPTTKGARQSAWPDGIRDALALASAAAFAIIFLVAPASAQGRDLEHALGERVEFLPSGGDDPVDLQVTIFQPAGYGPFPVVVINHGLDIGDPRRQARNRPLAAARQFVERGYAVIAPMLRGFAGSGGTLAEHGCNTRANGEAAQQDLNAVVRWLKLKSWADTSRMVMTGQSYGGLNTMAYSQNPVPGFKLFVNFAGGVKYAIGCEWELRLQEAFESYGKLSRMPSMWFYGQNDSYFPPRIIAPAFEAFKASGGNGELVAYGAFKTDAHAMFANHDGVGIWLDTVLLKMKQQGLPVDIEQPDDEVKWAAGVQDEAQMTSVFAGWVDPLNQ